MTRLRADGLLLIAAAIWGLSFVYQKTAMDHVGPFAFLAGRALLSCVTLSGVALVEHRRAPTVPAGDFVRMAVASGATFFVAGALQQFGITGTSATNSSFLTGLYVVLTPLSARVLLGERLGSTTLAAAGLAAAGMWLLGGGRLAGLSRGDLLVASGAGFWALHVLCIVRGARHGRPFVFTVIQFGVVFLLALPAALASEVVVVADLMRAAPEIAYLGIVSGGLAYSLMAVATRYTTASEAAVLVSMESVFGALFAALLLGERLGPIAWVGAASIFGAGLLVRLRGGT